VKISCPACAAKYSIADEKVSDRLAKIRCRKCGATIVIDGKANPPSVYTAAGDATTEASDDAGDSQVGGLQFTVDFGEGDQRTMPVPEIVAAYNAGQITQDTYLWADGFADWKPLAEVDEVVSALNAGGAAAAAPAAAPWAAAAASPARTAARTAGRAPAPDLFGGIDAAGSEDDVATSAPEHSPAGRGGGGGGGLGASASAGGAGTGARNESSVLFSLSALTSAASRPSSRPVAPLAQPSGAATREDSGLIDLKALTAAATKSEAMAAPALPTAPLISPLAASPLGIASPLGGGLAAQASYDYGAPPAKNKTGLFIGGGIAVAAIAAVAIAIILRPPPPAPAAPPVAAAPAPAPAPTPAPTPEVTATPPSTGTAETGDAPKAGKPATGGVRRTGGIAPKKGGGGTTTAPPAAEAPAAPKPKKNPCGCAAGDLQCAMRCAAG
jgi:predicted Zn finger-like uncharacterized protein